MTKHKTNKKKGILSKRNFQGLILSNIVVISWSIIAPPLTRALNMDSSGSLFFGPLFGLGIGMYFFSLVLIPLNILNIIVTPIYLYKQRPLGSTKRLAFLTLLTSCGYLLFMYHVEIILSYVRTLLPY